MPCPVSACRSLDRRGGRRPGRREGRTIAHIPDGVLAAPIRLLEEAGDQRFTWSALVILDLEANQVDLLGFGFARLSDFSLVRSFEP